MLTGITDAMVANAPTFAQLAKEVSTRLEGRVFVAHNARFDWGFVGAEVKRNRDLALDGPRLCTVRLARSTAPPAAVPEMISTLCSGFHPDCAPAPPASSRSAKIAHNFLPRISPPEIVQLWPDARFEPRTELRRKTALQGFDEIA